MYENVKTLNHEFFLNERHFINYCLKVCSTMGIGNPYTNRESIEHFLWSLVHETVFKRNGIKPPYAILMSALKKDVNSIDLDYLYGDYLTELIKLRYGNISIDECEHVVRFEFYDNSAFNVTYGSYGYTQQILKKLQEIQGKSGVYKLYDKEKNLIYIGKSYTLSNRLTSSIKEQRASYCKVMETDTQSDANLLEIYYISEEKPSNNGSGFTFDKLTFSIKHNYKFSPLIKIFNDKRPPKV